MAPGGLGNYRAVLREVEEAGGGGIYSQCLCRGLRDSWKGFLSPFVEYSVPTILSKIWKKLDFLRNLREIWFFENFDKNEIF